MIGKCDRSKGYGTILDPIWTRCKSRIRDIPKSEGSSPSLSPFLVGNIESGGVWKTRGDLSRRAKGFLRVFSSVKVILGGRIPLTVDRPTGKAVHRCTCGFRVD